MWTIDEIDEVYAPIKLNWSDDDDIKLKIACDARALHKKTWGMYLKRHHNDVYEWLLYRHPLLDMSFNLSTKLYWLMHKMVFWEKCPICGKTKYMHKNVDTFERGYFRACCKECAAANPERQKKIADTTERHYGSRNFFTSDAGKEKIKKYLDEHGVINPFQIESVKLKSNASRKEHFGYEYTMQSPEKRKLASDNYKAKTGYDHQFHNPEVQAKIEAERQRKIELGIDEKETFKKNWRKKRYDQLVNFHGEVEPRFSFDEYKDCTRTSQYTKLFKWHCNKCDKDFEAFFNSNLTTREHLFARCPHCHPIHSGTSKPEQEMIAYVKSLYNGEVKERCKNIIHPFELDCFIPNKKIAFEFDGLFFHSEKSGGKDKFYHVNKTNLCEKHDIQLIHIFEDEWIEKNDIVKSRISNLFGIHNKVIYARNCIVTQIYSNISKQFQEENHIQGSINAKINLGLYYNDELVSLMTFGKSRFSKKYEWELLRFCNKLGYHIPGAASKLLKHFERNYNPKSLISYADRRWSRGKLYEALGFTLDHISEPNYWYLTPKTLNRFSRQRFQKNKLKEILPKFDETMTEVENMLANDYDRIFDCGNLVYVKTY